MERMKEPNKGMMSPPGGKLNIANAESPSMCAVREAFEECAMKTQENDWRLNGIVTEKDYPSVGNIMIFLMEYKNLINKLPEASNEGAFHFIHPDDLSNYNLPVTDKVFIWDNVFKNNGEAFVISLDCTTYPDIKQIKS